MLYNTKEIPFIITRSRD